LTHSCDRVSSISSFFLLFLLGRAWATPLSISHFRPFRAFSFLDGDRTFFPFSYRVCPRSCWRPIVRISRRGTPRLEDKVIARLVIISGLLQSRLFFSYLSFLPGFRVYGPFFKRRKLLLHSDPPPAPSRATLFSFLLCSSLPSWPQTIGTRPFISLDDLSLLLSCGYVAMESLAFFSDWNPLHRLQETPRSSPLD